MERRSLYWNGAQSFNITVAADTTRQDMPVYPEGKNWLRRWSYFSLWLWMLTHDDPLLTMWPLISDTLWNFMEHQVLNHRPLLTLSHLMTLRWRHNGRDSDSNHQSYDCLLNRLFRRRSKKTSTLRVTGLCVGNSPGFPFDDVIVKTSHITGLFERNPYRGGGFPHRRTTVRRFDIFFVVI